MAPCQPGVLLDNWKSTMALDVEKLRNWKFDDVVQAFTKRDTMLYALGVGCGSDPLEESDLRYVYEDNLVALPTMVTVLGYQGFWLKESGTGVDWRKVVHGEQSITIHAPVPNSGTFIGRSRITGLIDKGKERGAILVSERRIIEKESGTHIATLVGTSFMRGDGGFGVSSGEAPSVHTLPEKAPDATLDIATLPRQALIYRLSGDMNPLHADPAVSAVAGFRAPILHGLCSFGVAGRALAKLVCGSDATLIKHMQVRFSSPIYPGETVRTEVWRNGSEISFRSRCVERDVVILNNGLARIAKAAA
jgi:acyl dehydratase